MVDLYLNPATGDLDLTDNTLRLVTRKEDAVRQKILITLQVNRGEWVFNVDYGVPYLSNEYNPVQLLGKTSKQSVDAAIKEAILTREGVVAITSYNSTLDQVTGKMVVQFNVEGEGGEITPVTVII